MENVALIVALKSVSYGDKYDERSMSGPRHPTNQYDVHIFPVGGLYIVQKKSVLQRVRKQ